MPRPPAAVPALGLALLLLTGCTADGTAAEQRPSPDRAPTASAEGKPTPRAEPARPLRARADRRVTTPRAPAPAPPSVTLRAYRTAGGAPLLAAREFGRGWSVAGTGRERGRLVSGCQQAPLVDIGALTSRIRRFAADGASARQAVARFADSRSAWRADRVVAAWGEECADALRGRGAALGAVRHRARLSVVEIEGVSRPGRRLRRLLDDVAGRLR
jgi:hypothetical protein